MKNRSQVFTIYLNFGWVIGFLNGILIWTIGQLLRSLFSFFGFGVICFWMGFGWSFPLVFCCCTSLFLASHWFLWLSRVVMAMPKLPSTSSFFSVKKKKLPWSFKKREESLILQFDLLVIDLESKEGWASLLQTKASPTVSLIYLACLHLWHCFFRKQLHRLLNFFIFFRRRILMSWLSIFDSKAHLTSFASRPYPIRVPYNSPHPRPQLLLRYPPSISSLSILTFNYAYLGIIW